MYVYLCIYINMYCLREIELACLVVGIVFWVLEMHKMLGLAFWDSRVGNYRQRRERRQPRRAAIYRSRGNWLFISQTNKHIHIHINFSLWQKREQRASNLHSPTAPSISYKATLLMSHFYYYYYTPPPPHALTYFRTSVHSWAAFVDWMPIGACIKYTFSMLCTYFSAHTTLQNLHKKCMNAVCVWVCVFSWSRFVFAHTLVNVF